MRFWKNTDTGFSCSGWNCSDCIDLMYCWFEDVCRDGLGLTFPKYTWLEKFIYCWSWGIFFPRLKWLRGDELIEGRCWMGYCCHFVYRTATQITSCHCSREQDKEHCVPLVVRHKLIRFADIELQVIIVTPCDEALYQSSVLNKQKTVSKWRQHISG